MTAVLILSERCLATQTPVATCQDVLWPLLNGLVKSGEAPFIVGTANWLLLFIQGLPNFPPPLKSAAATVCDEELG